MRLADEYDAAQEAGEVAGHGGARNFKVEVSDLESSEIKPTLADLKLSKQDLSDARQIRDAEAASPGIVRRAVGERVTAGMEPA